MTNQSFFPQLAATVLVLFVSTPFVTHASILAEDDFSYADGNLVGRGSAGQGWSGGWTNHFGAQTSIVTTSGVVTGQALSGASQRIFRQLDAAVAALADVVRRYQEMPTPLVRDRRRDFRTGRLDLVLAGHFDLMADR